MRRLEIISKIEKHVNSKYRSWYVGITNDEERRKDEHRIEENVSCWKSWETDSPEDAEYIEKYFIDKNMKGAPGGTKSPNCVYIF